MLSNRKNKAKSKQFYLAIWQIKNDNNFETVSLQGKRLTFSGKVRATLIISTKNRLRSYENVY